ncbi:MAG: DUF2950 domain-containing protein [Thermoanaerobaculaceae bacterium]|nr:DUF2950 domain-containing protein [Thermoanaerobaculaceae bacterium]
MAAADAIVTAAETFNLPALKELLGSDGIDLVVTEDQVQDQNQAKAWAALARQKLVVAIDPADPNLATLSVGPEDWPLPIPVVRDGSVWRFDVEAGREEVFLRRIGRNELDAIEVCRRFVVAQHEYAMEKRDGSRVNQYAQHVVSTPGRQDGLAWQNADGTLGGPLAEGVARAIAEGYTGRNEPYHGYYFKVLKGQGPSAPLGDLDFVVQGAMIGGFALVAAPADYEKTGVKTFIVGYDGVVYEKDLGPDTVATFRAMERFDPDESWSPVEEPSEGVK